MKGPHGHQARDTYTCIIKKVEAKFRIKMYKAVPSLIKNKQWSSRRN